MVHDLVVARERNIKTRSRPTLNNAVLCQRSSKHWWWSGLSGDHYAWLPSNNFSQTAFKLWKPKENSGRQQLSGAPHATHAKSVNKRVSRIGLYSHSRMHQHWLRSGIRRVDGPVQHCSKEIITLATYSSRKSSKHNWLTVAKRCVKQEQRMELVDNGWYE